MNVWRHIPTIFKQRHILRTAGILSLCIALITTLFFASVSRAAPGINKTLSFQGRLLNNSGGIVPDGHYNIQFKIYQDGAGTTAGNPGGTLKWTESYINNNANAGVEVTNGYFSVNLGSINAFGSQVDWNQDTLWLSMNVAGSANACTTFNSAPCVADGEMLKMKQITATPFALNSAALDGLTSSNFIQMAQGLQDDASANPSIGINKTSTANFLELQSSGEAALYIHHNGDMTFGSNANHYLGVAGTGSGNGRSLTVYGGNAGSDGDNTGGDLILQGGNGGGVNGEGGNVTIDAGVTNGNGAGGAVNLGVVNASAIYVGSSNSAFIQIGNPALSGDTQDIRIGDNSGSGTTNVTVGSSGSSGGGTTTIQSKDDTTISTNGTQRARFSSGGDTLYVGNADTSGNATTASSFTIQGTSSTGNNTQGGSLNLQSGSATNGNANGGNITISAGNGSGNGATGLVIINTPTFQTAGTQTCGSNCSITQANLDSNGVVSVNATADDLVVSLADPTITTAGRIVYVMATENSKEFTLSLNGGGAGNQITMRKNTASTLLWSGSDWVTAGGSNSSTLQDAYNSSAQNDGSALITTNSSTTESGLTIRNSETDPTNGSLLSVQSSPTAKLFSVNANGEEFAQNGDAEAAGATASDFPAETWESFNAGDVARYITAGDYVLSGKASVQVSSTSAAQGVKNTLRNALKPSTAYQVRMSVRLASGTLNDLGVYYSIDGAATSETCTFDEVIPSNTWKTIDCTFNTPASGITPGNSIIIGSPTNPARTYAIDNMSVKPLVGGIPNVKVGGSESSSDETTLFTLDKSASSPVAEGSDSLLGSMYYDTTLGKVQCYEEDGWGACGAAPDNFVTLSPEYANAVMNGTDIGTITSDLCSDALNINDGSSAQPTICGANETFNFYKWTSAEADAQTRSIYVTYQLPATFKEFVSGLTSLMGRTDDTKSAVTYQIYRDHPGTGLASCGSAISVSTGVKTTWQKATATGSADPAECGFEPGDSILFRINLTAEENANAYVSNLNFTYSNN